MAAYALGLAHTNNSPDMCVQQLLTSADGCTGLLYDARAHLATMTDMDNDLRIRAGRLLTTATAVSDEGGSAAVLDGIGQRAPTAPGPRGSDGRVGEAGGSR